MFYSKDTATQNKEIKRLWHIWKHLNTESFAFCETVTVTNGTVTKVMSINACMRWNRNV